MHEFPITMSIVSIVLEKANAAQASKITNINLTIGNLSGIVPECVEIQFKIISRGTIAEGASLIFYQPPSMVRCRNCDNTFSGDNFEFTCPNCQEQKVEILSGRECSVETIEVE